MMAVILNSGMGTRMGEITKSSPKCMTVVGPTDTTILGRQLMMLKNAGIENVLITTGPQKEIIEEYCHENFQSLSFTFINNPRYADTNYIYSLYLAREHIFGDILLLHGDLVFEDAVLKTILASERSSVAIRPNDALPEKDFKARMSRDRVAEIGVNVFDDAVSLLPLYHLMDKQWEMWKKSIVKFCKSGEVSCYAENAFNVISEECQIFGLSIDGLFCMEVDEPLDLEIAKRWIRSQII